MREINEKARLELQNCKSIEDVVEAINSADVVEAINLAAQYCFEAAEDCNYDTYEAHAENLKTNGADIDVCAVADCVKKHVKLIDVLHKAARQYEYIAESNNVNSNGESWEIDQLINDYDYEEESWLNKPAESDLYECMIYINRGANSLYDYEEYILYR
jgi:hypothetical protein